MLEITKYVRKPFVVEAVRVTAENMDAVSAWSGSSIETETTDNPVDVRFIKVKVARVLNDRQTKAYIGDWVLYAGSGFKVYTDKAFIKSFDVMDGETKDAVTQAEKPQTVEELRTVTADGGTVRVE